MLKIYNTLDRTKEGFRPIKVKKVNMFVCGPTVYDDSHIGHGKTYVQFDVIVRYLRWKGFHVNYLMNITDIDDKIIHRALEEKIDWKKLTAKYTKKFYEDMKALGNEVDEYAKATDYVKEIIVQVQTLLDKKFAYEIDDGVYFDITKFPRYGDLSKQDLKQIRSGARVDVNLDKKSPGDFVLWKRHKEGEPFWESPWGKGRPGWHIEDTAMTEKHFGPQYDIHGGAIDLIFPHHECEIAQMESASGKEPLVRCWMHAAFLNIDKEKMSKSLGNIISISEAIEKWGPKNLRYYYAINHYRTPMDYSDESVSHSKHALNALNNFIQDMLNANGKGADVDTLVKDLRNKFEEHMDNDFDTPQAIAAVFDFMHEVNKLDLSKHDAKKIIDVLKDIDQVFQVLDFEKIIVPKEIQELVAQRERARKNKDWDASDELRDEIKKKGFVVEDSPQGPRVKKA